MLDTLPKTKILIESEDTRCWQDSGKILIIRNFEWLNTCVLKFALILARKTSSERNFPPFVSELILKFYLYSSFHNNLLSKFFNDWMKYESTLSKEDNSFCSFFIVFFTMYNILIDSLPLITLDIYDIPF